MTFINDFSALWDYIKPMEPVLLYLLGFAMFATVAVLVVGVFSFAVQGDFYLRHANHLMRARVILQGMAVAILALMVYLTVG